MLGFGLLFLGILTMIFNSPFMNLLYAFIATLLYGMYLIYDTQLIAGGRVNFLKYIYLSNMNWILMII